MAVKPTSAGQVDQAGALDERGGRSRRGPLVLGLALVPGSTTLILLRLLLLLLAGAPVGAAAWLGLQEVARQPYFTGVQGPLPLYHLGRLWQQLPGTLLPCLIVGVTLAVLAHQFLLGGALDWLRPDRAPGTPGVLRAVAAGGVAYLGRMLRVLAAVITLDAAGLAVLRAAMHQLERAGEAAGWTALTLELRVPACFGLLALVWLGAVGCWGFACRLVLVTDRRRLLRSAAPLALRLLRRKLWSISCFFVLVTCLLQGLWGLSLCCWRQAPPHSVAAAAGWVALGLSLAVLQAAGWHWLLRGGLLVYAGPAVADLRAAPDAPWGWAQLLAQRLKWRSS